MVLSVKHIVNDERMASGISDGLLKTVSLHREPFHIPRVTAPENKISGSVSFNSETFKMTLKTVTVIAALMATAASLASCGNTIRGVGQDAANTVNATQDAGRKVERAAR